MLGREFSLDLLSRVADLPASDVADQLDVARAHALLTGGDAGRLRFNHVLTQKVAYAELAASHRRSLHLRAGDTLRSGHVPELKWSRTT